MIQTETILSRKLWHRLGLSLALTSVLSACALPTPEQLPSIPEAQERERQRFVDAVTDPIEYVSVPGSSMKPISTRQDVPPHLRSINLEVRFNDQSATLGDLVNVLGTFGIQLGFRFTSEEREGILRRKLPFLRYNGDLGGVLDTLRGGLGVVSWYENGVIFLSDQERYSVAFPQNEEILSTVAEELTSMGATNITTSVRGGKLVYTASPSDQDELIGPFLNRLARNLSMITLQVAVVSLAINDNSSIGFDWNAFSLAFDSTQDTLDSIRNPDNGAVGNAEPGFPPPPSGPPVYPGPIGGGGRDSGPTPGFAGDLSGEGLSLKYTKLGNLFGTYGALSVGSALNFLSNFGNTNVSQNVELKTLSGTNVVLRSGQEVPYVKEVNVNNYRSNNDYGTGLLGGTETDTVQTGLTIDLSPYYDSDAEVVTLEIDVELKSILDFVELSAGAQLGSLTQPLTQDQSLTDIVRVPAGRTVVIGGLQYDSETYDGVEPAFMRDTMARTGTSFGKRGQQITRNALFIILRPSVTVFVPQEAS